GNRWIPAKVHLGELTPPYNLKIIGVLGRDNQYSYVSVDDFLFYEKPCDNITLPGDSIKQCDLEDNNKCGWKDVGPDMEFIYKDGNSGALDHDHTYSTDVGHYFQLSSNQPEAGNGKKGALQLPVFKNMDEGDYCFQLYYARWGGTKIIIQVDVDGEVEELIQVAGGRVNDWEILQVTHSNFVPGQNFTYFIEGVMAIKNDTTSIIAIDDFSLGNGACPEDGSCEFEDSHLCTWQTDPTSEVQWRLTDGRLSEGHGPERDHTSNKTTGGYIVIEDYDLHTGAISRLLSEMIDNDVEGFCFSFFFSMKGDQQAKLKISVQEDLNTTSLLWKLIGAHGPNWSYGQVAIPGSTEGQFSIVIEAIIGDGANGWLALDDLHLDSSGAADCGLKPSVATPSPLPETTTPMALPTTTEHTHANTVKCDFNWDMCGWKMIAGDNDDNFLWSIGGPTGSDTGPNKDHTSGD
ncbi:unnamed protein product, partial [Meganyctiphanes norvegica]